MTTKNLVQVSVNIVKLVRFYGKLWPAGSPGLNDEFMLVKTALTETFVGEDIIRPWRIQSRDEFGNIMILGYSTANADRMKELVLTTLPELAQAFCVDDIFSMPMRKFRAGERVQLQATVAPKKMVRHIDNDKGAGKVEVDVFKYENLKRIRTGEAEIVREDAYAEYFRRRVGDCVRFEKIAMKGITGGTAARKSFGSVPDTRVAMTSAEVIAVCEVVDPEAFTTMLFNGVGRAKAYGHGMVLVRAAA